MYILTPYKWVRYSMGKKVHQYNSGKKNNKKKEHNVKYLLSLPNII